MEGPHIALFAEQLAPHAGVTIVDAGGETRIPLDWLTGRPLPRAFSRGKLLFFPFDHRALRVHFLMFGDLRINREWPGKHLTLWLKLANDVMLRCYMSSVQVAGTAAVETAYPAQFDIMSPEWAMDAVVAAIRQAGDGSVCDLLLDQRIFMGVGNKMKNEILWRRRLHPLHPVHTLSQEELRLLAGETRSYARFFYNTIAAGQLLDAHLAVYKKKTCPDCGSRLVREKLGLEPRVCFYCPMCQELPAT